MIDNHPAGRPAPGPRPTTTLLLGYGNELRGDDAVGPRVAAWVEKWDLAGVLVHTLPQLTPELAEPIAQAQQVIFVDAANPETGLDQVRVTAVSPAGPNDWDAHGGTPKALLALTQAIYGRVPRAWLITIPTAQFDYGAPLTPEAEQGLAIALQEIQKLLPVSKGTLCA